MGDAPRSHGWQYPSWSLVSAARVDVVDKALAGG
jgi:hypothetical protein